MVCTANRCRSPMAEVILRRHLDERQVEGQVTSAGFLAPGYPAMDEAIEVMAADGFDLTSHRSRLVTPELVNAADLVIGMTRQHVIDLVLEVPERWSHLFGLRDLVRRAEAVGRQSPFEAWLAAVGAGRTRAGLLSARLEDDIPDPVGEPLAAYQRTRETLTDLLARLSVVVG